MKQVALCLVASTVLASVGAQADGSSDAVLRRLDALEKQNAALRDRVKHLEAKQHPAKRTVVVAASRRPVPVPAYTAVDLPPVPAGFSWAGGHVGALGGVAVGSPIYGSIDTFSGGDTAVNPSNPGYGLAFGGLIGAEAGYDWQSGAFVYGVEGDFAGVFESANLSFASFGSTLPSEETSRTTAIATIRARAGISVDRALLYGTVGLGEIRTREEEEVSYASGQHNNADWTPAFAIGGGIEYALTDHFLVKGEGIYLASATQKFSATFPLIGGNPTGTTYALTPSQVLARAGVDYKF